MNPVAPVPPQKNLPPETERRVAEIYARLAQIDHESVRPLRAIMRGLGSEKDISRMASLETEADELRAELGKLKPVS